MTETELQEIEKHWTSDFFIGYSKSDLETLAKKDTRALLSTVRELQRQVQERWIPIEKQHPEEEGRYFILYSHKGQPPKPFVADLSFDGLGWAWSGFINDDNRVTHWMPIPEQTP